MITFYPVYTTKTLTTYTGTVYYQSIYIPLKKASTRLR